MIKWKTFKKRFYDYQVSVYRMWIVLENNEQIKKQSLVYEKIACGFWKWTVWNLLQTELAQQTQSNNFEINLKPENNNVKEGDNVDVYYNNILQWRFLVSNVIYNNDSFWRLENIELLVKTISNATTV
jgi:hypothetical protein